MSPTSPVIMERAGVMAWRINFCNHRRRVLGLRNSPDKMFPAGIVAGASVFVCDNLSFSGVINLARKHPRFIFTSASNRQREIQVETDGRKTLSTDHRPTYVAQGPHRATFRPF